MIVLCGERSMLVRLAAGRLDPSVDGRAITSVTDLPIAEVCAVFFEDRDRKTFPDLIVVDTQHMQEFYAWASTYVPQWSPLSSCIQVIERRHLSEEVIRPARASVPPQFFRGLTCLIVGELLYEWRLANGRAQPNLLSLRSTFSYAATCSLLSKRHCLGDLLARWFRAQHLLQVNPRKVDSKTLKSVWSPIFSLVESRVVLEEVDNAVDELANVVARESQGTLFREKPVATGLQSRERREDVVVELQRFIGATKLDESIASFEVARIASKMSASPLSHFDVLGDMVKSEPRSLLWYSFLSGLFATDAASLSIERLLFQLEGDLRSRARPRPDVSLDELDVLIRPKNQLPEWVGTGARLIIVELEHGICSSFRLQNQAMMDDSQVAPLQAEERQLLEGLLSQLRELFDKKGIAAERRDKDTPRKNRPAKRGWK